MRRLPRRLVLWGGAAAIASGGFAFMASNTVASSGAGEGVGTVSGYTVSGVKYTTHDPSEPGAPQLYTVTAVTFKLSVPAKFHVHGTPVNTTAPTQVMATLLDDHGKPLDANGQGANPATCKATGPWNNGSGNYVCYFTHNGNAPGPGGVDNGLHVKTVTGLDVEANQ